MKFITCHYKRIKVRSIKIAILAVFVSIFFLPSYMKFESTGDNMYTVFLNDVRVGTVGTVEEAESFMREARKQLASDSEELVLVEAQLRTQGSEVLWGQTDDPQTVISNMAMVLADSVRETMNRSYIVKINELVINLADEQEVLALLQAAIDKYDSENKYTVEVNLDPDRELSVLTTNVKSEEEIEVQEEEAQAVAVSAGIDAEVDILFENIKPAKELDFKDYDLGLISMDFGDTIEVVEAYLATGELTDLDVAIERITKEKEKNEVYEVQPGDTLSEISITTNIPVDRLIELNENLEDERSMIRPGDELIITVPKPELTVVRQEEQYYEEDYEADIIYVDNDEWYTTDQVTLQEPSAGHRKVVAIITYENDKETGREIVKQEVTYEAIPKIVERGTKIPPTYIKPISGGRLSSKFGRRNAPTRGASSYHKGVDWATPTGTAVVASSGGKVARAGWASGYGYVVYINHEDGRQTRYGHLSKVLVSAGQTVSQGQKIALSGNTGVSTGPHLHFEILVNGKQVDPFKYLN